MSISRLLAPPFEATSSFSFGCTASDSLFCERWIRNTIRKVTTVVAVLMTSCQVFENPNSGPLTSQAMIRRTARLKPTVLPVICVALVEKCSSQRPNELRFRGIGPPPLPADDSVYRDGGPEA